MCHSYDDRVGYDLKGPRTSGQITISIDTTFDFIPNVNVS